MPELYCPKHGPFNAYYESCPFCSNESQLFVKTTGDRFLESLTPTEQNLNNVKTDENFDSINNFSSEKGEDWETIDTDNNNWKENDTHLNRFCLIHGQYDDQFEVCPYCKSNGSTEPKQAIPLIEGFRFIHEPLSENSINQPINFSGREESTSRFVNRIRYSDGGAFLVTGFRGVGKTTFVNHSLSMLKNNLWNQDKTILVEIRLNLARTITPIVLMHLIVRKLHQKISDMGLLGKLNKKIVNQIRLAYQRTTLSINQKHSHFTSLGLGISTSLGLIPEIKASKENQLDTTYLEYDENAAEADIIEIGQKILQQNNQIKKHGKFNLFQPNKIKIIFVFDELDKIDELGGALPFSDIFSTLKNLFVASGFTYIFVAGQSMHRHWITETQNSEGILESIFSEEIYLPALWKESDIILQSIVSSEIQQNHGYIVDIFKGFLHYKGRGLPRLILRNINKFVVLDGDEPKLIFSSRDIPKLNIFHDIDHSLANNLSILISGDISNLPDEYDSNLLAVYYFVDWILSQQENQFSLTQARDAIINSHSILKIDKIKSARIAMQTIKIMVVEGFIEEIIDDPENTIINHSIQTLERKFCLAKQISIRLQQENDDELNTEKYEIDHLYIPDRFNIQEKIAFSQYFQIYKGYDLKNGSDVIIKTIRDSQGDLDRLRSLLTNESHILLFLTSSKIMSIPKHIEAQLDSDRPFIIRQYIHGPNLNSIIKNMGVLELEIAISLFKKIAFAINEIHKHNVCRLDIKPANIVLSKSGEIFFIDFGSAILKNNQLKTDIIGTPQYISPEQIEGNPGDIRSDIYSLGSTVYYLFTGKKTFDFNTSSELYYAHANVEIPRPSIFRSEISEKIETIIIRCLEKKPENRFQNLDELLNYLDDIPNEKENLSEFAMNFSDSPVSEDDDSTQDVPPKESNVNRTKEKYPNFSDLPGNITQESLSLEGNISSQANQNSNNDIFDRKNEFLSMARIPDVATLVILTGNAVGRKHRLGRETKVGRGSNTDIFIDDPEVSRFHFELKIEIEEQIFLIRNSSYGNKTLVNDKEIDKFFTPIKDGDVITVGQTKILFLEAGKSSDV